MLSGERAILIKSFIEDRERLGTISQKPIESVFDKNIYSSILSHKEQKSLEESIHLIQDNSGEIDLGEMMDNMKPPERNNDENDDNNTMGPQNSNIYEHEIKSILLTDMMSKKENEDQSTLKSITVSPESLESEQDKKKRKKKKEKE